MKACANISVMYNDIPFMERIPTAAAAGFKGVEIPFPYDMPAPELLRALGGHHLDLVMIACPPPNYTGSDRGFAAVPGAEGRFRSDFQRSMRFAKAMGVDRLHIISGNARGPEARETLVSNLRWALDAVPGQNLTIEPMCREDAPGYYLNSLHKAADIVREIGSDDLGLQFDTHHVHQIHSDVISMWDEVAELVTHVQIAQSPARVVPDAKGEIDMRGFLKTLKANKYAGWVSGEYYVKPEQKEHLFWLA